MQENLSMFFANYLLEQLEESNQLNVILFLL